MKEGKLILLCPFFLLLGAGARENADLKAAPTLYSVHWVTPNPSPSPSNASLWEGSWLPALSTHTSHHRCAARSSVAMADTRPSCSENGQARQQQQATPGVRTRPCDHCGKVCSSKAALARHIRKRFKCKSNLKHILTHSDVKNFECLECGKKFQRKSNLNTHMLIHTDVKNFECFECGKKFKHKSGLNEHMLTHTGVKNFECLEW